MTTILTTKLSNEELTRLLKLEESHFCDLKAIDIAPGKLTRSLSAFANAEGGEIYIGIDEDVSTNTRTWRGFERVEDANAHIQTFNDFFPLSDENLYELLINDSAPGNVLKVQISKSRDLKYASNGKVYIRRGAQNQPVTDPEKILALKRSKGLVSFETEPINCNTDIVTNSEQIIAFMIQVVPSSEPETWLSKQQIIVDNKPTVAGLILFADEPQAILPKRCGIKLYRYKTSDAEGTRDTLDFDPLSIEGCAYQQIGSAVQTTAEIIESVRINTPQGLQSVSYPATALHEIITNAVLHRDYSIADDIHIKIFDNRVEVLSPGSLPGHVTVENILDERFARNGNLVRLINKFPNPPNKDVGEGLNTAFQAMREMKLKDPVISQSGSYVAVVLRHESLASPEEMILEYLQDHENITNRIARDLCYIGSENKMKTILQRMIRNDLIELVPGRTRYTAAYQLKSV